MRLLAAGLIFACAAGAWAQGCPGTGAAVQVLGSGEPGLAAPRAASGALVWSQGRARALVNAGPGAALRFAEAGADPAELDVVLLSRLDIGYSGDLAAIVEAAQRRERSRILPVYGPRGNNLMPSTVSFVRTLFDPVRGAWRYLGDLLKPLDRVSYKLRPFDISHKTGQAGPAYRDEELAVTALPGLLDGIPTLAWRLELEGRSVVFGAGTGEPGPALERFAAAADLLVLDEPASSADRNGAEAPAYAAAGQLARKAGVRGLVFVHRAPRAPAQEEQALAAIRKAYEGPASFADDLGCYGL